MCLLIRQSISGRPAGIQKQRVFSAFCLANRLVESSKGKLSKADTCFCETGRAYPTQAFQLNLTFNSTNELKYDIMS